MDPEIDCYGRYIREKIEQIHAALGYYFDNREEIDAELAADDAWADSLD